MHSAAVPYQSCRLPLPPVSLSVVQQPPLIRFYTVHNLVSNGIDPHVTMDANPKNGVGHRIQFFKPGVGRRQRYRVDAV
jgi:hypothetical protein